MVGKIFRKATFAFTKEVAIFHVLVVGEFTAYNSSE